MSQFESLFTYYKLEGPMPIQEYISKRWDNGPNKTGHFCQVLPKLAYLGRLSQEPDPVSLWLKDKGRSRFNTQLRDLGYNGKDIGANATKLAAVIR